MVNVCAFGKSLIVEVEQVLYSSFNDYHSVRLRMFCHMFIEFRIPPNYTCSRNEEIERTFQSDISYGVP